MRALSKHLFAALLGTALITSCSRPVAYFQPTHREQFASTEAPAVTPAQTVETTVAVETLSKDIVTPTEQIDQTKQAVSQVEAYVRNDSKLASNKKLAKRMTRLNELLTAASAKAAVAPAASAAASTQKTTLMQRMMLKKMDKRIKNHVAPDQTKAMNSNVRLGIIIGLVGLLLLLLGGGTALSVIGLIGFIVGIVLVILGVANT